MSIELKDDLPAITPAAAAQAMKTYQAICKEMLDDSDYATIAGKKFKTKSAYRKLARAFQISDEIIKEEHDGTTWRIHVKASAPNGRAAIGIGACSSKERAFAHPDHDIYATAHTRAKNRAISDLIGMGSGEPSFEEMEGTTATKAETVEWKTFGEKKK